jgi:hypothetical protein
MKKTILALTLVALFASTSFAGVSFLTATSVGEGKFAILGMYGTNHLGAGASCSVDPSYLDIMNLGVRVEYGTPVKDLDVLAAYSVDSMPNLISKFPIVAASPKLLSASTTALGVKYSVIKDGASVQGIEIPMDVAVGFGFESSSQHFSGIKDDGLTTWALAGIFSKKIDNMIPYGAIAYKSLSQNAKAGNVDSLGGVGLAFNLGLYYGIAKDQAVVIEYNTEQQAWTDTKAKNDAYANNVSGISLGYVYMF